VLENMVRNNYPSRSEIAHLGYLIENGFSGIVLSDETAIGNYPIEAVEFCRDYFQYVRK
jgi:pyruvate kinase